MSPDINYRKAIGLEVKRARPRVGLSPSKEDMVKHYDDEVRGVRDVAAVLGCSKDMAHGAKRASSAFRKDDLLE